MGDKQNAARVAWATIKLSQVGQRPVSLDRLAAQVGLAIAEAVRLLHLTWQERIDLRDGMIRLDATPAGPRRYQVHAGGRPVGSGKGCSVGMYLLALALGRPIHAEATCPATGTPITVDITPDRVERIDPPTADAQADPPLPEPDGPVDPTVSASPIEEVPRPGRFTLMAPGWMPPAQLVTQALGLCFA